MRKNIILSLAFFTVSTNLFAQIDIINTSLLVPDSNTIFVGVQNVVSIEKAGKEKYELRSGRCHVQSNSTPEGFIVMATSPGTDTLWAIHNGKKVYSKVFTLSFLPPPQVFLGSIRKDVASKEEIVANKGLVVRAGNFKKNTDMVILSYTVKIKSSVVKEGDDNIANNRNLFTEKVIAVLRSLTHNDVITFDDIKVATGPNFCPRALRSFSVTISKTAIYFLPSCHEYNR